MSRIFYELERAAQRLGIDLSELESMVELRELTLVRVGSRRLVHVRDVEKVLSRVERGGPLRTRREYFGGMVPEAVREAAAHLGVAEDDLVYEVLEHPQLRMPGVEGRPARIAVELPPGAGGFPDDPAPRKDEAVESSGREMVRRSGNVPLYEVVDRAPDPETRGPEAEEDEVPVERAVPAPSVPEGVGVFYAPEQVARLLGRRISEVNGWIHRRDLPAININDYLWVPEEAVLELLKKEPPLGTGIPPKPFRFVVPTEETAGGSVSRLGDGEVVEGETREALRRRVAELEGLIEELRGKISRDEPLLEPDAP